MKLVMNIYSRILKDMGITNPDTYPLRDMNTVTDEQIERHGLMTDKMFRDFQKKVLKKRLP